MAKFTAVIGDSNRILSVGAATEEQARAEIDRQLRKNPQRLEIRRQWQADGAKIVEEPRTTTAVLEPFVEAETPEEWASDEHIAMIESARELIAEGAETLRAVANETNDRHRLNTLVASLETLVGAGGWSSCKGETLTDWVNELIAGKED